MLPFRVRVDLGAIAMKGYSAFPTATASLDSHRQIVSCHIQDTSQRCLTLLQRCSQCILQPRSTGQQTKCLKIVNHHEEFTEFTTRKQQCYRWIAELLNQRLHHIYWHFRVKDLKWRDNFNVKKKAFIHILITLLAGKNSLRKTEKTTFVFFNETCQKDTFFFHKHTLYTCT